MYARMHVLIVRLRTRQAKDHVYCLENCFMPRKITTWAGTSVRVGCLYVHVVPFFYVAGIQNTVT